MIRTKPPVGKLSTQMKRRLVTPSQPKAEYDGDSTTMINSGSTLLNLAVSGGRVRGGGIPAGILVEIFGPSGSGKTVLLSELAGEIQRQGGQVMLNDPEARLNKQFVRIFGLDTDQIGYARPDTVPEVFSAVRSWKPEGEGKIHGIFADSLAALSTDMEMGKDEGDKMGMRRAKEFSEELRKTCRVLAQKNYLMVCSNQVRQNVDAGQFGQKYTSPGGEAIAFYSSLRLRTSITNKIKAERKVVGKDVTRIVGVNIQVEVFKSSVWKPFRTAPLTILFDYGIDNIRQNLQFVKDYTKGTMYMVRNEKLDVSMDESIRMVEEAEMELALQEQVIELWERIESKFESNRKAKLR